MDNQPQNNDGDGRQHPPKPPSNGGGDTGNNHNHEANAEASSGESSGGERAIREAVAAVAPFAQAFLEAATVAGTSIAQVQQRRQQRRMLQQQQQQQLQQHQNQRQQQRGDEASSEEGNTTSSVSGNMSGRDQSNTSSGSDGSGGESPREHPMRNVQNQQQQDRNEEDRQSNSCTSNGTGSSEGYRNDGQEESESTSGQDKDDDTDATSTSNQSGDSDSLGDDILFIVEGEAEDEARGSKLQREQQQQPQNQDEEDSQMAPVAEAAAQPAQEPNDDAFDLLGRLLEGHPPNRQLQEAIRELAQRYNEVKNGFRETAVDVLMRQVQKRGGRFLRKGPDGTSKPLEKKETRRMLRKIFKKSCQKVDNSAEAREERRQEREEQSRKRNRGDDDDTINSGSTVAKRQRTRDRTHMIVDLSSIDKNDFFSFGKSLSTNQELESMQVYTSPLTMVAANAVATGLKKCKKLQQIKLSFTEGETFDGHLSVMMEGIFENRSIQSINLNDNSLDGLACEFICNLFVEKTENRISRLCMENNPIGDVGAKALAKAIAVSSTLRYICLGNNGFTEHGIGLLTVAASRVGRLVEVSGLSMTQQKLLRTESSNQDMDASKVTNSLQNRQPSDSSGYPHEVKLGGSLLSSEELSSSNGHKESSSSSDENHNNNPTVKVGLLRQSQEQKDVEEEDDRKPAANVSR